MLRTPPVAALYHRVDNPVYAELLDRLGHDPGVHAVVLPRLREQADELRRLALPSVLVPEHAVDGPSLVSASDLVISAGGSMNREAVALGVPVYTTFQGRMGGVDEKLLREGRLRRLEHAGDVAARAARPHAPRLRRDPQLIVDLILGTLGSGSPVPSRAYCERVRRQPRVVVLDRVHERRGVGRAHVLRAGTAAAGRGRRRRAASRSSQASSTSRGRMTGMRSCTGATSAFAVVVMIVQVKSDSPLSGSRQIVHRPAKPNGAPSSSV